MGMFPWDDLFFNIKGKQIDLNNMYNDYISTRDTLNSKGLEYKAKFEKLQAMSAASKALLINAALGSMDDTDYDKIIAETRIAKTPPIKQPLVAEIFSGIADLSASLDTGAMIFGFGKIGWANFKSWSSQAAKETGEPVEEMVSEEAVDVADNIGITEAGEESLETIVDAAAEAGEEIGSEAGIVAVEAASETATLAATSEAVAGVATVGEVALSYGPGIMIALGIDMIIGAIEGAKEEKEIKDHTTKLKTALDTLAGFVTNLNNEITKVETLTLKNIKDIITVLNVLSKIQPATFNYNYPADLTNIDNWYNVVQLAQRQYLYIGGVREDFKNRIINHTKDHPGVPITSALFATWIDDEAEDRDASLTYAQANAFIQYVLSKSAELNKYTK